MLVKRARLFKDHQVLSVAVVQRLKTQRKKERQKQVTKGTKRRFANEKQEGEKAATKTLHFFFSSSKFNKLQLNWKKKSRNHIWETRAKERGFLCADAYTDTMDAENRLQCDDVM